MLHKISANKKSFQTVIFKNGINIILADASSESNIRDTRNSVGKTTLIKIINFCLGGSIPDSFKNEQLIDWKFYLTLSLLGHQFTVTRAINDANKIFIEGNTSV